MLTLQDLGEHALLQRLHRFCPPNLIGDDGAVLPLQPGHKLVVTTDVLVENVHFSDQTTSGFDVGWRAAAANLSDLAAMGAEPVGLTVGLSLPPTTPWDWLGTVYQGLIACSQQYQTAIVGGDLTRGPIATLAITALGQVQLSQVLQRSAAQVGDRLLVTGVHGASRAGLELLLHPDRAPASPEHGTAWIAAHQRPQPRLDLLPWLRPWQAQRAIAAMDSSDGLADAVVQICRASGVGAKLLADAIPIPLGLAAWVGPEQTLNWALYGGEDFELVLALPLAAAIALQDQIATATIIGEITPEPEVIVDNGGETLELTQASGFQHFNA
ncbi:MAG: thiamine-phosphate kinase [Spirulina sp. SIO3F2]|nr:thiamine-phosphate kinase [Spirulina sp. SIO3F2]